MSSKRYYSLSRRSKTALPALMRAYGLAGAAMAIIASAYFLLKKFKINVDPSDFAPLTAAAAGISLFIFSRFYLEFYKEKNEANLEIEKKDRLISLLLHHWAEFEDTGRRYIGDMSENHPVSVRHILRSLTAENIIDTNMVSKVEKALSVRNRVAHGMEDEISREEIVAALDDITTVESLIISKMISPKLDN